jgi:uncharacterized lipoprotein YajG
MKKRLVTILGVLVGSGLLAACQTEPTQSEQEFGDSVRQMVSAQKYQPAEPPAAPSGMDGRKAEKVMQVYREDVAQPKQISNEIYINVGN